MSKKHKLKILQEFFEAVNDGRKTFEIDEFGEVPESEEAVYMAINALKERKTGKWEKDENGTDHCSCCDYIPAYDTAIDDIFYSPYCPNCGAKMAAADEEGAKEY